MEKEIYKDSTKTVEERVEDLLARMTLEEKAAQLCGNLAVPFVENGKVSKEKLRKNFLPSLVTGKFSNWADTSL